MPEWLSASLAAEKFRRASGVSEGDRDAALNPLKDDY